MIWSRRSALAPAAANSSLNASGPTWLVQLAVASSPPGLTQRSASAFRAPPTNSYRPSDTASACFIAAYYGGGVCRPLVLYINFGDCTLLGIQKLIARCNHREAQPNTSSEFIRLQI